jgi:hypothetical protein
MLSVPLLPLGPKPPFTRYNFVVLAVVLLRLKHNRYGLTAAPPYLKKTIAANGRNSINASVLKFGGLGVQIAQPLI